MAELDRQGLREQTRVIFTGAEVSPDLVIDGRSFAPQLLGQRGTPREWVFVMLGRHWYVRDAGWKLTDTSELFDMRDAPFNERKAEAGTDADAARLRLGAVRCSPSSIPRPASSATRRASTRRSHGQAGPNRWLFESTKERLWSAVARCEYSTFRSESYGE